MPELIAVPAPVPPGRVERLLTGAPPPGAGSAVVALVLLTALLRAVPVTAPAAPAAAVLAVVAAALWSGRWRTAVVLLAVGAALQPLPPTAASVTAATAVLAVAALLGVLVRGCAASVLRAQSLTLRQHAAREEESRTARRQEQDLADQLEYWATHDALTRLLNRGAFARLVDAALEDGRPVAVLVVSVTGFTAVNAHFGHDAGDAALVVLGQRLDGGVRDGDRAARVSGDAFAVLLTGLRPSEAASVGGRLLEGALAPLAVGEHVLSLRARAGVAVSGDEPVTGAELLRCAEAAARTATPGRPPSVWAGREAQPDDGPAEADLARGLAAGELFLVFQPLVSTATGRVRSVEALVRWAHPSRGLVPPDDFIGLAERTGLVVPLGLRVLELACAQLRAWADVAPDLTVAVNVSARQLAEPGFVDDVRRLLWASGVDPARIVLELTESLLVEDGEAAVAVLWQLRGLGVRLALDDFGTGYSSLARLGELPLDEMKVDKSFVDRLGAQPHDSTTLLTAAVAMGQGLGLEVVAEGVETAAQAHFLREVRCDLLQGYLFSRPVPAAELAPLLGRVLLPPAQPLVPVTAPPPAAVVVPALMPSSVPAPRREVTRSPT